MPDEEISLRELMNERERVYAERDRRYEDKFKAMDEKTSLALASSKEAVNKAEAANEKRFQAMNEFRGTLSDQAATFMTKAECVAKFTAQDEKIADLRESRSEWTGGKAAVLALIGTIVAIGLFVASYLSKR